MVCGQNENKVDSDGDGICDATEARVGTNPQQADSDGDGISYVKRRSHVSECLIHFSGIFFITKQGRARVGIDLG